MFEIRFLPARFGDCIWLAYGDPQAPRNVLVDGGTGGTRHDIRTRLEALPADQRRLELLVVSHIDRDHIGGILGLLDRDDVGFEVGDIWFNGLDHLPRLDDPGAESLGALQAERLSERLSLLGLPWNQAFGGEAVVIPEDGPLPVHELTGGLRLTLLSPTHVALARLRPVWEREVREAGLVPGFGLDFSVDAEPLSAEPESLGTTDLPDIDALAATPFDADDSAANGSSIAFLAEHDGKRVLLAADANAASLRASLDRLAPGERVPVDLFKISHHGSRRTTSTELIEQVSCPTFVFSTNTSVFKHPHHEAVARVIKAGPMAPGDVPHLVFNYRKERNEVWDLDLLKTRHRYRTTYPPDGEEGVVVTLG